MPRSIRERVMRHAYSGAGDEPYDKPYGILIRNYFSRRESIDQTTSERFSLCKRFVVDGSCVI